MRAVYKYQLIIVDSQTLTLPVGSKILHVGVQKDQVGVGFTSRGIPAAENLFLWASVPIDSDVPVASRYIRITGTGYVFNDLECEYLGTVMMMDGQLVWHIFEEMLVTQQVND